MKPHETFISTHPGEDRDSDSEEEGEDRGTAPKRPQLPVPIQDEVVEPQQVTEEDVEMQNESTEPEERDQVRDTGEVENDE